MEKFGAVNGDLTDLRWPDFLKRAQWIRFSVQFESLLGNPTVAIPQPEVARANEHNINYALYSLCSFLQGKHSLVAIEVDAGMKLADILVKPARGTCEVTALYVLDPLQLLGPLPLFKIINYDGSVAQLTQSSFPVQERLDGGELKVCERLWTFYKAHILSDARLVTPVVRELEGFLGEMAQAKSELNRKTFLCTSDFESSIRVLSFNIRSGLERFDVDLLERALRPDVYGSRLAPAQRRLEMLRGYRNRRKELEEAGDESAASEHVGGG
ncbi:hypothetical protein LTR48_005741 [Friedmanniomyces endolithicus]|uniref:Uncharacterized protein n=1 Tax=Rachicladosporium monterosium TaxID=1507873 RepID=A0ABR0L159_9PEZI|nr:hypothetical protein LTR48_005741 [Friedmanniomyces endolithicus]KAK5141897.1 hypothetical protein LTR32_005655 [Rachicladosporium monterosium]